MMGTVLSPGTAALILFGIFFFCLFVRVPVAFALALACLPILLIEPRLSAMTLAQETFNAYNSFILLAVPFFLLTANLMNAGGITDRLLVLSRTMVGHFPGGLLAVIIPPSILMIVWGGILTVSIGALFLAGIVPGLLIGLVQMATVHAYAKIRGYPTYPRSTWMALGKALLISVPALMTPFIIVGGKIFGWFTATESACIAVLYAGAVSLFLYREMDFKGLHYALLDTGKFAAIALFCVGTASAFGWLLAYYEIPKTILSGVSTWNMGLIGTGFFIAGVFLVVGCFLDAIPAIIIVGTILDPLSKAVGMDPVHFAIIGIVSLAFGLVTPPYGLCLLIACAVAKMRMVDALKDTFIMLLPMLGVLALVIVWPDVALFLPKLISPEFLK
jgi:tripartite ATP-independent transporter DctM subunit